MNHAYEEFCAQVKRAAKKATSQEKAQLTRELMDHLEDHAEALTEEGWEEAAAARHAVESMGDPIEIGRQYSDQLSSFWLWCVYGFRLLLCLLVFQMLLPAIAFLIGISQNMQARQDPIEYCSAHFMKDNVVYSQDLDMELHVTDQILRVVRIEVVSDETVGHKVHVFVCVYADTVYEKVSEHFLKSIGVTGDYDVLTGINTSVGIRHIQCDVEPGTERLELIYEQNGKQQSVDIPLEWEGMP